MGDGGGATKYFILRKMGAVCTEFFFSMGVCVCVIFFVYVFFFSLNALYV